ncbi:hypothetical protein JZ751_024876, partial [Albula glossodonta]
MLQRHLPSSHNYLVLGEREKKEYVVSFSYNHTCLGKRLGGQPVGDHSAPYAITPNFTHSSPTIIHSVPQRAGGPRSIAFRPRNRVVVGGITTCESRLLVPPSTHTPDYSQTAAKSTSEPQRKGPFKRPARLSTGHPGSVPLRVWPVSLGLSKGRKRRSKQWGLHLSSLVCRKRGTTNNQPWEGKQKFVNKGANCQTKPPFPVPISTLPFSVSQAIECAFLIHRLTKVKRGGKKNEEKEREGHGQGANITVANGLQRRSQTHFSAFSGLIDVRVSDGMAESR